MIDLTDQIDQTYIRRGYPATGWGVAIPLYHLATIGANVCNGVQAADTVRMAEIAAPTAPASGKHKLYFAADGNAYLRSSAGAEASLTGTVTNSEILQTRVFSR